MFDRLFLQMPTRKYYTVYYLIIFMQHTQLSRIGLPAKAHCDSRKHFSCHKMVTDSTRRVPLVVILGACALQQKVLHGHCQILPCPCKQVRQWQKLAGRGWNRAERLWEGWTQQQWCISDLIPSFCSLTALFSSSDLLATDLLATELAPIVEQEVYRKERENRSPRHTIPYPQTFHSCRYQHPQDSNPWIWSTLTLQTWLELCFFWSL